MTARSAHRIASLTALGTGELMPSLILGFERTGETIDQGGLMLEKEPPAWLFDVFVQAGGYAMSYYSVVGAVFRLADNAQQAVDDPAPLLRAFHLMAEDPDMRAIRSEYPSLVPIVGTSGKTYDAAQLHRLGAFLNRFYPLPSPKGGLEAFVRLGPVNPKELVGWTHLHAKDPSQALEDAAAADGVFTGRPFAGADAHELGAVGRDAFSDAPGPELFLVWENSD